jgi:hypothetical protein
MINNHKINMKRLKQLREKFIKSIRVNMSIHKIKLKIKVKQRVVKEIKRMEKRLKIQSL